MSSRYNRIPSHCYCPLWKCPARFSLCHQIINYQRHYRTRIPQTSLNLHKFSIQMRSVEDSLYGKYIPIEASKTSISIESFARALLTFLKDGDTGKEAEGEDNHSDDHQEGRLEARQPWWRCIRDMVCNLQRSIVGVIMQRTIVLKKNRASITMGRSLGRRLGYRIWRLG